MEARSERLQLDAVLASQPELGPAVPDGGHGWAVLAVAVAIRIIMTGSLISCGVYLLFSNQVTSNHKDSIMWGNYGMWMPVFLWASWNFIDPWSMSLPSGVSAHTASVFGVLSCSISMLAYILIPSNGQTFLNEAAIGFLAGMGTSLATTQADLLLEKYFLRKLIFVRTLMIIGVGVGCVTYPIMLSFLLVQKGCFITLLIQTSLIMHLAISTALLYPPKYEQANNLTSYSLLQNEEDSQEIIFDVRDKLKMNKDISNAAPEDENVIPTTSSSTVSPYQDTINHTPEEMYPQPLFCDNQVAVEGRNMAFFIEDPADDEVAVYTYGDHRRNNKKCFQILKTVIQPTFYFLLLISVISKITTIVFWLFLPIFTASKVANISFLQASAILGISGFGDIIYGIFYSWLLKFVLQWKHFLLPTVCFMTSASLFGLGDCVSLTWIYSSAVFARLCICAQSTANEIILKDSVSSSDYKNIKSLHSMSSALGILLTALFVDPNFDNLFRTLAWCHLSAALLLCIHLLLRIATNCSRQNAIS